MKFQANMSSRDPHVQQVRDSYIIQPKNWKPIGAYRLPRLRNNLTSFYRQGVKARRGKQLAQSQKLSYNQCHIM